MFDRNFMEYHKDRFVDYSLVLYDDNGICAILPASLHGTELRSHGGLTYGGFIVNSGMKQSKMNACFDATLEYLRNNRVSKVMYKAIPYFYHSLPAQEDIYSLYRVNAKILKTEASTLVDFEHPIKLPKGRKAQISRANREGVFVMESSDFDTFIELENSVLQERHHVKAVHTGKELYYLKGLFPNNIKLYVAYHDTRMIAGALIFIYDNVIHTQYLSSDETGRKLGALDLTISTIMDEYKDKVRYLDFGISTEDSGKVLNEGLISQKESFGGRTVVYQTWELVIK